ncbi:hypothetical protein CROQUDRAFT_97341 [Cronartium quercuum f. sp. fusiforme G11]|uniref:Uncharacterized protein n=1 Tax=Cronartium quercuum f. sp. fusiforme G11 TaxID=708437 RepID=A0A9P6NB09_9BASI|nr:hypothetical protein CROQUDRAFT_97341 [Cronartium quercuum f. sp. fusiforme G11]
MGIGPTGQIYLNCAHKDPHKGFKGGCGFFAPEYFRSTVREWLLLGPFLA